MRLILLGIILASLAACGSSSDSSSPGAPPCRDVWKDGLILPTKYAGCTLPTGELEAVVRQPCVNGHYLETYGQNAWAFNGRTIHVTTGILDDPGYSAAYSAC